MRSFAVGPVGRPARAMAVYLLAAAGVIAGYAVVATLLWINRDFADDGPLSFTAPRAVTALDAGTSLATVRRQCRQAGDLGGGNDTTKIVAARVGGVAYYACYQVERDGTVLAATVVDGQGIRAPDEVIKKAGAWRWIGTVKTPAELVLGGVALTALLTLYFLYHRRARPGAPVPARWWQGPIGNAVLGVLLVLPLTLPFRRGESRARRIRLLFLFVFGTSGTVLVAFLQNGWPDRLSSVTLGWLLAGMVFGWLGGGALLRPAGFGRPDTVGVSRPASQGVPAPLPAAGAVFAGPGAAADRAAGPRAVPAVTGLPAAPATAGPKPGAGAVPVQQPGDLPTFADVGGMGGLKAELADTVGTLLAFTGEAEVYRISFNGILLHGPPGAGKTFVARAT
ncbi:MAG TPA: hypothetical protein VFX70_04655, partial [Mycobacteriales bacterium]|nr:hypothetical protein [Mycobacteriales bacterium]